MKLTQNTMFPQSSADMVSAAENPRAYAKAVLATLGGRKAILVQEETNRGEIWRGLGKVSLSLKKMVVLCTY